MFQLLILCSRFQSGEMQNKAPDFYLSTAGEYSPLSEPRACWAVSRFRDNVRDDYMEIAIVPPLIGQPFGLGDKDIDRLVIASRLQGFNVHMITQWPVPIYVLRIKDDSFRESGCFQADQVDLIAWGQIFEKIEQARLHAAKFG